MIQHEDQSGPSTSGCEGLPVLLLIALIEVVQVADVCSFDAHQAGQTLHVFITADREMTWGIYFYEVMLSRQNEGILNHVSPLRLNISRCLSTTGTFFPY